MMASEIHQETFPRCIQTGTPYPEAGEGPGESPTRRFLQTPPVSPRDPALEAANALSAGFMAIPALGAATGSARLHLSSGRRSAAGVSKAPSRFRALVPVFAA